MKLAKEIIDGLANIQNSNIFPEKAFLQLLDVIVSYIFNNINDGRSVVTVYPSKSDMVKAAIANIACLFIEAARHDYDEENLKLFLHSEHINGQRIEKLCNTYMNNKQDIQIQLELIGNSMPHIMDMDWNLHHCVKVSTYHFSSMPYYNIRMNTRQYNNRMEYIIFMCTVQQLQELVYRLKDIVRHIEKISNI